MSTVDSSSANFITINSIKGTVIVIFKRPSMQRWQFQIYNGTLHSFDLTYFLQLLNLNLELFKTDAEVF